MPVPFHFLLVILALLATLPPAGAQPARSSAPERYGEVRLLRADAVRLAAAGVHLDHARPEQTAGGPALRTVLSASELDAARAAGVPLEVLTADLAAEVAARPPFTEAEQRAALLGSGITGNIFGSMGGFPTFAEALAILDDMRAQYPHLVAPRLSLGQSHEGRDIWMVEVSDNPGVDEGEPEVLITALHHAREPASLTTVLYTMWYLLEHYDESREIRALVSNRRLFVVPVLNPDGYVYNETTNPNGGGFWRKNRRVNGDGSRGVDLNRNYGYQWGYNNQGSSPTPSSDTYRGPSAFSEPETRALRDFLEGDRAVATTFNYHTYGDLLLLPWAYRLLYTPDHARLMDYAAQMTAVNGYTYGTSPEVLYASNGNANDWLYGEQATKPKVLTFTPEVGSSFWPPPSQIVPLAQENLRANLLLMRFAGFPTEAHAGALGAASDALSISAPNPISGAATLSFSLPAPGPARLAVYDVLGREVAVLADGTLEAGSHTVAFGGWRLPSGTYLVRLTSDGQTAARQFVLAR